MAGQNLDRFGGWTGLQGHNTSGFFRVEKISGRYWLVDPDNNVFWSVGANGVLYGDTWGGNCPALNYNPLAWGLAAKYNNLQANWVSAVKSRNTAWNLNTLACWSSEDIGETSECAVFLALVDRARELGCRIIPGCHIPDVFDAMFTTACNDQAQLTLTRKNQTFLIGYFFDNEVNWARPGSYLSIADAYIAFPPEASGKQYWVNTFLNGRYPMVTALNAAWGTSFADWNAVLNTTALADSAAYPARLADKLDFAEAIADQYYRSITTRIRQHDPNHLIFSDRWMMTWYGYGDAYPQPFNERFWKKAGQYCDIIASNGYTDFGWAEANYQYVTRIFSNAKKPIIITENTFLTNDTVFRNYTDEYNWIWHPTQMARAATYKDYLPNVLNLGVSVDPNDGQAAKVMIGMHWFACYDESALGRWDGEAMNCGILNIKDEAYTPLVDTMATVHKQIYSYAAMGQPIVVPAAPTPLAPAEGTILPEAFPTLQWSAVSGAVKYTLLLSPEACFPDEQTIRIDNISSTLYSPGSGLAQGTWYWTVRAIDGQGRGGEYFPTATFTVGNIPTYEMDKISNFAGEAVPAWKIASNVSTQGDGTAYIFRDTARKASGNASARLVFTINSLNKTSNAINAGTRDIECILTASSEINYSGMTDLSFRLYPQRFVDRQGYLISPSKYLRVQLWDAAAGKVLDASVDAAGNLPRDTWSRVSIPLGSVPRSRVNKIVFIVNCGTNQPTWDERMVFNIDEVRYAYATVTGKVVLQGYSGNYTSVGVTFQLQPVGDGDNITRHVLLNADGTFTLDAIPQGTYNIAIQGDPWGQTMLNNILVWTTPADLGTVELTPMNSTTTVPLANGSFENPAVGPGGWSSGTNVPGWETPNGYGYRFVFGPTTTEFPGGAPDGNQVLALWPYGGSASYVSQGVDANLAPGDRYVLTVQFGNAANYSVGYERVRLGVVNTYTSWSGWIPVADAYWTNVESAIPQGAWQTVTLQYDVQPADAGKDLMIEISGSYAFFDNVSLTKVHAPVTVTGAVALGGYGTGSDRTLVGVRFEFRPTGGGTAVVRNAFLDSNGRFSLALVPGGSYSLAVKACSWLQAVVPANLTADPTDMGTISLIGGNSDGDTAVTSTDLAIVLANLDQVGLP